MIFFFTYVWGNINIKHIGGVKVNGIEATAGPVDDL